jgi:nicotinate-nucleotide adenylyltransferase
MTSRARIGILGGTFDPVHLGHVETALAAQRALHLDRVLLLPSGAPPHRTQQPSVSRFHRFAMVALAVTGQPSLQASDLESGEAGPSYTYETLARLQADGLKPSQIFFITGADAFAEIATWSRYPLVLDMATFVVVSRPGSPAGGLRGTMPALANRMRLDAPPPGQIAIVLVDAPTPDVSSTEIRRRLEAGGSLEGLVPPAVATYIDQHGLYSRAGATASTGRSLA